MSQFKFEKAVNAARKLTHTEMETLHRLLTLWLKPPSQPMTEEEFEAKMVRQGHLNIPGRPMTDEEFMSYVPIEIQGKPLSETIIEERR
jgi:hypothetical protein